MLLIGLQRTACCRFSATKSCAAICKEKHRTVLLGLLVALQPRRTGYVSRCALAGSYGACMIYIYSAQQDFSSMFHLSSAFDLDRCAFIKSTPFRA